MEDYILYRPRYPAGVLDLLRSRCGLTAGAVIADVGSGTGILSELFLENGNVVFGIEPNREMREAAERLLARYPSFHSVSGRAEETTLPAASVDFVTAAQAFHWFDRPPARREFARILKSDGWLVLLWNDRDDHASPFLEEYEALLQRFGTDYGTVKHRRLDRDLIAGFFGDPEQGSATMRQRQEFDLAGVRGRLLSSSYVPAEGQPGFEPMIAALRELFDRHQVNGRVVFEYVTTIYYGRLRSVQNVR